MRETAKGINGALHHAGFGDDVPERLTVACVKWGDKYGAEYVKRLKRGVERNLQVPHQFVCFTEKPVDGIECRPLPSELPIWWSKIGLAKPGLFDGDVLYLDLDVIVTAALGPIVSLLKLSPGLWARDDFSYSIRNPRQGLDDAFRKFLGGVGTINSSVMLWRGDVWREVWDTFTPDVMKAVHGDQNWISKVLGRDRICFIPDDMVSSLKYHVWQGKPHGAIVVCHGDPKPPDLAPNDPLRQMWEAA